MNTSTTVANAIPADGSPNVLSLRAEGVQLAYNVYRDLRLAPLPPGEAGEALVSAVCTRWGWTIEIRHVSMVEHPHYTGFVRRVGHNHWVILVRDDVTAGQADIIIAHEVAHILRGDVTAAGQARPRVIRVTPPEVVASAFAVTIARLFVYGDPEGEREQALAQLPDAYRSLLHELGPRRV